MITACGWCPTELPNDSPLDVAAHFSNVHRIHNGSQSLRYLYPENIDAEFARWADRASVLAAAETPDEQR